MTALIQGAKGGSKSPKPPKIAPDSARSVAYAKLLYFLSEGEIVGPVDGMRSVKLDGTPLLNADGSSNFPGVSWDFRPGTQWQDHIAGFGEVNNEIAVGIELTDDAPWTRAAANPDLSALRLRLSWPALQQQKSNGDVTGYRIEYAIDLSTAGGAFREVLRAAVDDKVSSKYERCHRIDLPETDQGWKIRVRRLTKNQNNSMIADSMRIEAITEVIDAKLRYPNTAVGALSFDASQFQNIPKVSAECEGRIIRVPTNYDPKARTYTGIWDGTFKQAYTNNPAWIWYDLVLHKRYGLGRRIDASMVDRWALYRIARYCDQLVPDGQGGQQPRFTCNLYLQEAHEGWAVLADLASIFHGMSYWDGAQMTLTADMPDDDEGFVFTRGNVIDGHFEYAGSDWAVRRTVALVNWDNPDNEYQTVPEPVTNHDQTARLGIRSVSVGRIGCTVQGEAQRHGQWLLKTEELENRTVTFKTGMEGTLPRPGKLISVADELFSGRPNGGRISSASGVVITLDRVVPAVAGDRLILNLPSGKAEARTVRSTSGKKVTVTTAYSEAPQSEAAFALDYADLAVMRFRVQTVTRAAPHQYEISAVLHVPGKYDYIDHGARIEQTPISVNPLGVQAPPPAVWISAQSAIAQGLAVTTMVIAWTPPPGAIEYDVEWRRDNGSWVRLQGQHGVSVDVVGIYAGHYQARVCARNAMGVASVFTLSAETELKGKVGNPPALAFLRATGQVFGILLEWGFPARGAEDCQRTELQYAPTVDDAGALHLGDFAYPNSRHTLTGLRAGQGFYFRGRLVDRTGNVGPWCEWNHGEASSDADAILDQIAGAISETELGQQLLEKIEQIAVIDTALLEQAADLLELQRELAAQRAAIADAEAVAAQELIREAAERVEQFEQLAGDLARQAAALIEQKAAMAADLARLAGDLQKQSEALLAEKKATQQALSQLGQEIAATSRETQANADALAREMLERLHQGDELGGRIVELSEQADDLARQTRALRTQTGELTTSLLVLQETTAQHALQLTSLETTSGQSVTRISQLEETTEDHALVITHLRATVGEQDAQLTETREVTAHHARQLVELQVSDGRREASILRLDDVTAGQAATLEQLSAKDGELASSITSTQQATAALAERTSTLEASDRDQSSRLVRIEEAGADHALAITHLQATAGEQDAQLTETREVTADHARQLIELQVSDDRREASILRLDDVTASQARTLEQLSAKEGELSSSITTAQQATAALAERTTVLESSDKDQSARLVRVEEAGADQALAITHLQATAGEQDAQLTETREVTADHARQLVELQVSDDHREASIRRLDDVTAGQAASLEQLTAKDGELASSITSTQQATAALGERTTTLEASDAEQSSRLVRVEEVGADHALAITHLQATAGEQDAQLTESREVSAEHARQLVELSVSTEQQGASIRRLDDVTAEQAGTLVELNYKDEQRSTQIRDLQQLDAEAALRSAWMQATDGEQEAQLAEVQRVAADSVTETRLLQVKAGQQQADLLAEQTARVDADGALGRRIDTVQTTAGNASSSVQQTSSALASLSGKLSALWSVKTQVSVGGKRVLAGIGVGVEQTPAGMQSQVLVLADRFAVLNTGATDGRTAAPFAIEGGQVFMREAFIRNASITGAKIADASITSAKIQTANIDTLHLKDGAVTLSAYASSNGFQRYFTAGSFGVASGVDNFSTLQFPTRWGDDVTIEGHFRLNAVAYSSNVGRALWLSPALYLDGYPVTDYSGGTWEAFVSTQHIPITMRARIPGNGATRTLTLRIAWSTNGWKNGAHAQYEVRHCILSAFISRK
ncbi:DUF1983 domain-containing protein [Pseudomonas sp. NPDC086581]|uniref:TipJ family phage tail tip protein n=1 Tax=Pseudomonas sp. NPDC086581 TaxID=3364432 RepID=UPI003812284E